VKLGQRCLPRLVAAGLQIGGQLRTPGVQHDRLAHDNGVAAEPPRFFVADLNAVLDVRRDDLLAVGVKGRWVPDRCIRCDRAEAGVEVKEVRVDQLDR